LKCVDSGTFPVFATAGVRVATSYVIGGVTWPLGARVYGESLCCRDTGRDSGTVGEQQSPRARHLDLVSPQVTGVEELAVPLVR